MKSYDINGYVVTCDNNGYRIRFYTAPFGYIGSYFKATRKLGTPSPFLLTLTGWLMSKVLRVRRRCA